MGISDVWYFVVVFLPQNEKNHFFGKMATTTIFKIFKQPEYML